MKMGIIPNEPTQKAALENRVAGVFVHVSDLRRSAEWYSRLLGLPVLEERLNGGPVYWLELPGTHLILDNDSHNRQQPDWQEWQQPRLMLPARGIEQAVLQLQDAGAELIGGVEDHGSMAYCNFRDPEGNVLMACWTGQPSEDMADASGGPIRPRIGGVFLDVRDLPAAARWYCGLFGLQLTEPPAGETIYSVPVSRGASLLLDSNRHVNQESFTELFYLETDDFEAALAYARELGCELADGPNFFDDLSEFALLDPDGNRIVIAQMKG
ncbi:VOC family protein [Paenibacillus sp. 1P07SE]|uniref:VOC family protein n=1 Tax=Paenibacillus sp. 1P07SE TaxID=3132209 RepID=UPI0039A60DC3